MKEHSRISGLWFLSFELLMLPSSLVVMWFMWMCAWLQMKWIHSIFQGCNKNTPNYTPPPHPPKKRKSKEKKVRCCPKQLVVTLLYIYYYSQQFSFHFFLMECCRIAVLVFPFCGILGWCGWWSKVQRFSVGYGQKFGTHMMAVGDFYYYMH